MVHKLPEDLVPDHEKVISEENNCLKAAFSDKDDTSDYETEWD